MIVSRGSSVTLKHLLNFHTDIYPNYFSRFPISFSYTNRFYWKIRIFLCFLLRFSKLWQRAQTFFSFGAIQHVFQLDRQTTKSFRFWLSLRTSQHVANINFRSIFSICFRRFQWRTHFIARETFNWIFFWSWVLERSTEDWIFFGFRIFFCASRLSYQSCKSFVSICAVLNFRNVWKAFVDLQSLLPRKEISSWSWIPPLFKFVE